MYHNNNRDDFPIFQHIPELVYLDSANTSQKPKQVLAAVQEYYEHYNANIHRALYPIAEKATQAVEAVRAKVASFINAQHKEEVIFVKSATEAINLVAYSWGRQNITKTDTIVTSIMEHHANFVPWQQLALEKHAQLEVLGITDEGLLNIPHAFLHDTYRASAVDFQFQKAKLFALTYVSNMLGTINPLEQVIPRIKKKNPKAVTIIDASQAVPHFPIDVQKLDCDFLVFTGHKMLAETGIGILYGKKALLDAMQPFLYGGDMIREVSVEKTMFAGVPSKFEAGTLNLSAIISLGAAIDYLQEVGREAIQLHEKQLVEYFLKQLQKLRDVTVYGPKNIQNRSGVVSFSLDAIHPHDVGQLLGERQICIRAGHHCAMPLHKKLDIPASCRVSFYLYNTKEDIDKLLEGVKQARKMFQL